DGDRAGSRSYLVMENALATTATPHYYGLFIPGFNDEVPSFMINPFAKYRGLEFFGTYEASSGRSQAELTKRNVSQMAAELIYRFGKSEDVFVGGRYNRADGQLARATVTDVTMDRVQLGARW